jgi:hypothetical protein
MRISSLFVTSVIALACAHATPQALATPPISTVDTAVAPDSIARILLVDLHTLDSNLIIGYRPVRATLAMVARTERTHPEW